MPPDLQVYRMQPIPMRNFWRLLYLLIPASMALLSLSLYFLKTTPCP